MLSACCQRLSAIPLIYLPKEVLRLVWEVFQCPTAPATFVLLLAVLWCDLAGGLPCSCTTPHLLGLVTSHHLSRPLSVYTSVMVTSAIPLSSIASGFPVCLSAFSYWTLLTAIESLGLHTAVFSDVVGLSSQPFGWPVMDTNNVSSLWISLFCLEF